VLVRCGFVARVERRETRVVAATKRSPGLAAFNPGDEMPERLRVIVGPGNRRRSAIFAGSLTRIQDGARKTG